ncbi:unnamed protein product [Protopolystoma xenopodis]|uniref:Thyroglobulin type-1 domain-containing protein n=1 Tax=Protopolystoma xenopodis TaxID=117903 RepID=A0A448WWN9_9PLAT|nr:unnamed protein product [Protopolystoma xenopodis]
MTEAYRRDPVGCAEARRSALLKNQLLLRHGRPLQQHFMPECSPDGAYQQKQCHSVANQPRKCSASVWSQTSFFSAPMKRVQIPFKHVNQLASVFWAFKRRDVNVPFSHGNRLTTTTCIQPTRTLLTAMKLNKRPYFP